MFYRDTHRWTAESDGEKKGRGPRPFVNPALAGRYQPLSTTW